MHLKKRKEEATINSINSYELSFFNLHSYAYVQL